ncbi:unnamed protein product [Rhizoctonia solani]|uniref:Zn-dependent exopeptidase n=1 Tax=Rhizoctonia solani TaxID=456999 RepID=A0A8H3AVC8_9AGAM|nr:unnamed protein product [Rhizoctonia solani]
MPNSQERLIDLDPATIEETFLSIPSPDSAHSISASWTSKPHLAGSQNDYESALDLLRTFQHHLGARPVEPLPVYDAGSPDSRNSIFDIPKLEGPKAWIDTYYPLLETPGERRLELLDAEGTVSWSANFKEHPAEADDTVGAWHAWSKPGEVKGRIVYANYGFDDDYKKLEKEGYDVTGAIVLIRESLTFRGIRIKQAAEAGAVGCLTFKDPRLDGSVTVENGYKPWPEGPARNPDSITRGHVLDISIHSGDPTTPGYPSYRDAPRVDPTGFPAIPSLPISPNNANFLLKEIEKSGGKMSEREVRIVNNVHRKIGPIWNVMAAIPGHIRDEVVIAGNHRDAWVFGASDPTSGTVSLHEMSRGLGELLRRGWKPLRTILLASWDAEEVRFYCVTVYAPRSNPRNSMDYLEAPSGARIFMVSDVCLAENLENNMAVDWLKEHAVVYLNVDRSSSGSALRVRGTPSIAPLLHQVALDLPHYDALDSKRTLWDARKDVGPFKGPIVKEKSAYAIQYQTPVHGTGIKTLGSGSDYTVFLQQLGITCGDLAFVPANRDATYHYHSFYDSEAWMDKYGDPGCLRRVAIAKYWGLVLIRIADSFVIPFDTTQYALELDEYLDKVVQILPTLPGAPDVMPLRSAIKKVQAASRSLDLYKAEGINRLNGHINHVNNHNSQDARSLIQQAFSSPGSGKPELTKLIKDIRLINKKLFSFERGFISEAGLPGREWYRHMIVAPGRWLGYGATTLPSLTEAIDSDRDPVLAAQQVERLTRLLHALADDIRTGIDSTFNGQPQSPSML